MAAIIVEDGTGVDGANSYVSLDDVAAYASLRGFSLAADETLLIPFVIAAMDYLESLATQYIGRPVYQDALQWPRNSSYAWSTWQSNLYLTGTTIPVPLQKALCQLVVEQLKGISINVSSGGTSVATVQYPSPLLNAVEIDSFDGRFTKRERVEGAVDVEYSEKLGTGIVPYMPMVDSLLQPILNGSGTQLSVGRA